MSKKIYVLVGPPSIGKTTWINQNFGDTPPYVISRDKVVEAIASAKNWTYDDLFVCPPKSAKLGDFDVKYGEVVRSPEYMTWQPLSYSHVVAANDRVETEFREKICEASGYDTIVVDMTNLNKDARRRALKPIEGKEADYKKIAVVFRFDGAENTVLELSRLRSMVSAKNGRPKTVTEETVKRIIGSFENICGDEGFDNVMSVDNRSLLPMWCQRLRIEGRLENEGAGA